MQLCFKKHLSHGDGRGIKSVVIADNWSTQRPLASKGEVYVQIDTSSQLSQLVHPADEAKTVPSAHKHGSEKTVPHLPTVLVLSSPSQHLQSTSSCCKDTISTIMERTLLKPLLLPLRVTEFQLSRFDPDELLSAARARRATHFLSFCSCIWVGLDEIVFSNSRLLSSFRNSMESRMSLCLSSHSDAWGAQRPSSLEITSQEAPLEDVLPPVPSVDAPRFALASSWLCMQRELRHHFEYGLPSDSSHRESPRKVQKREAHLRQPPSHRLRRVQKGRSSVVPALTTQSTAEKFKEAPYRKWSADTKDPRESTPTKNSCGQTTFESEPENGTISPLSSKVTFTICHRELVLQLLAFDCQIPLPNRSLFDGLGQILRSPR